MYVQPDKISFFIKLIDLRSGDASTVVEAIPLIIISISHFIFIFQIFTSTRLIDKPAEPEMSLTARRIPMPLQDSSPEAKICYTFRVEKKSVAHPRGSRPEGSAPHGDFRDSGQPKVTGDRRGARRRLPALCLPAGPAASFGRLGVQHFPMLSLIHI